MKIVHFVYVVVFGHSKHIEIFTIRTNNYLNKEERIELYFLNHSLNRKEIDVRRIGVFSSLKNFLSSSDCFMYNENLLQSETRSFYCKGIV